MHVFISPNGNTEVWDSKPDGYISLDDWLAAQPSQYMPTLAEAQTAKWQQINAGHEAALAGAVALSDPTPSTVAVEAGLLAASDPEGLEFVRNALAARRDALLSAVEAAQTAEEVQAITVSYAV